MTMTIIFKHNSSNNNNRNFTFSANGMLAVTKPIVEDSIL